MIDLLAIHPGAQHGIYGSLAGEFPAIEPPLQPRIIVSRHLNRGGTADIIDQEAEHLSPTEVADRVRKLSPRLVAICVSGHQPSASSQQMTSAREIAQEIKDKCSQIPILMLGNHPSALPERTLREEPVDFVCDGEGPLTIEGLLALDPIEFDSMEGIDFVPNFVHIPGLVWWDADGTIVCNPRAPLLDLDRDLHGSSVWHLLPMHLYRAHNWQCLQDPGMRQPYASIHTSLGCSFRCHFCMINVFQHGNFYRRRSPGSVIREMTMLYHEYGVKTFKITDELFVLNREHFRTICHGLIRAGIGRHINVWAYSRTDTVRADDLPLLRAAGIRWLALGIESGSAAVRAGANKALRGDDGNAAIRKIVREIQNADINVIGNYIFGLRDDTMETMRDTLDLAQDLRTEFANFYTCMAYPGSPLYDQAIVEGWTLPSSWAGFSQHNSKTRPLDTETVPAADVLRFRDAAFTTYFTDPGYLAMVAEKFGAAAVEEIRKMTEYKLHRNLLEDER